jgi:ABC-type glycerol-3-phosphate transport system substrate-binding protein
MKVMRLLITGFVLLLAGGPVFAGGGGQQGGGGASAQQGGITKYSGEIVVSTIDDGEDDKGFEAVARAYNRYQPEVKLIWEQGAGADYSTWLATQLGAGNVRPDIVSGNYAKTYPNYVDFNMYRNRINQYNGKPWQDEYDFDMLYEADAKGQRILLQGTAVHILWFYNKTIFDRLGLKTPTTDTEFLAVSDRLRGAGYTPYAAVNWQVWQWFVEVYADQFIRSYNEYWRALPGDWNYDEGLDGKFKYDPNNRNLGKDYTLSRLRALKSLQEGKWSYNSPEFLAFAAAYQKMFNAGNNFPEWNIGGDHYANFLAGRTGMLANGTWALNTMKVDQASLSQTDPGAVFEWGTFENPAMTGPMVQGPVRSVESSSGGYFSIVNKNPRQTEMVLDFLQFLLSTEGWQAWVDGQLAAPGGYAPSGPLAVKGVKLPAETQATLDSIQMLGNAEYGFYEPSGLAGPGFSTQCHNLLIQLVSQEITPQQYCNSIQGIFTSNFEQIVTDAGFTMDNVRYPERQPF